MLSKRLKSSIVDYPNFPKEGIIFKDISPILSDPELFKDLIEKISSNQIFEITDAIVAIDSRGFIFGSALAKNIAKPLILARKKNKLPGELIQRNYGLEYGEDSLSIQKSSIKNFQKFIIVDDLLATGGTAECVAHMLKEEGKEILALSVVIELLSLQGRKRLNIPVLSEIQF